MFSTTTKGSRRFHVVVAHLFDVPIDNGIAKPKQNLVSVVLVSFSLLVGDRLFNNFLFIQMASDRLKVALFEIL